MTIEQIREDLKEIQRYYKMKELVGEKAVLLPNVALVEKTKRYNKAISFAPMTYYTLYIALYINNETQKIVAKKWGVDESYICKLNKRLCEYLLEFFKTHN